MEFRDLNAQYQALKGGIDAGIARVLEHGRYIGGRRSPSSRRASPPTSAPGTA